MDADIDIYKLPKYADNGIRYKWNYDKSIPLSIERTINNINNAYTQEELLAFGSTSKPNVYLVNKIIVIYDDNDPKISENVVMNIKHN